MATLTANYYGGSASHTATGRIHVRRWLVDGANTSPEYAELEALRLPGIPRFGSRHPRESDLKVTNLTCQIVDGGGRGQYVVEATYSIPSATDEAEQGAGARVRRALSLDSITEETIFDINGQKLTVAYASFGGTAPAADPNVTSVNENAINVNRVSGVVLTRSVKRVTVERPTATLTFTNTTTAWPIQFLTRGIVGSVNDRQWGPFPAKTWLYRGLRTSENDNGNHEAEHVFTYRSETWLASIIATVGNIVPPDVSRTNGILFRDVYPLYNFNTLGFTPA